MSRGGVQHWNALGLPPYLLERVQAAFAAARTLTYEREALGQDYWKGAAEARASGRGDCEDFVGVFTDELLVKHGLLNTLALRLAVVDSGTSALSKYRQRVDEWGDVWVPGVDHATCLLLPECDPGSAPDVYEATWRGPSHEFLIDPTWNWVETWSLCGFRLVWSWGIEGGVGSWRKHFPREPIL